MYLLPDPFILESVAVNSKPVVVKLTLLVEFVVSALLELGLNTLFLGLDVLLLSSHMCQSPLELLLFVIKKEGSKPKY